MKKLQAGLLIEGNSTSSTLLRLAGVSAELGPIMSSGLQVARRVSNFLKAGYAVTSYGELSSARIILIRVPDGSVRRVVNAVAKAEFEWPQHSFVLCETWLPTEYLDTLRERGANVASLVMLPTGTEKTFAVEGDVLAVRQVRRLIERANARTIELRPGAKHLLFAATALCTAIPIPLLLMAQQALRDSGISGNQLSVAIQDMVSEMLMNFMKGSRTIWGGALADSLRSFDGEYWSRLHATHPDLAYALRDFIERGQRYMAPKMSRGRSD